MRTHTEVSKEFLLALKASPPTACAHCHFASWLRDFGFASTSYAATATQKRWGGEHLCGQYTLLWVVARAYTHLWLGPPDDDAGAFARRSRVDQKLARA